MPGSGDARPNKLAEATMPVTPTRIAGKFSLHSFLFQKKARTLVLNCLAQHQLDAVQLVYLAGAG